MGYGKDNAVPPEKKRMPYDTSSDERRSFRDCLPDTLSVTGEVKHE